MCDYSLMHEPNRLAKAGETLTLHRFDSGSLGFADPQEVEAHRQWEMAPDLSFWDRLFRRNREWREPLLCAVCIPPGARLLLHGIPALLRGVYGVGPTEPVTFLQLHAEANQHRDAVLFSNGRWILLQELAWGQRADVLSLTSEAVAGATDPAIRFPVGPAEETNRLTGRSVPLS